MEGIIKAHYAANGKDIVEVDPDGGGDLITCTQKLDADPKWVQPHQALQVGQRVAMVHNSEYGFWSINIKATKALNQGTPQAAPASAPPSTNGKADWPAASLQDYAMAAVTLLDAVAGDRDLAKMPDGFFSYVSTWAIAATKNPKVLEGLASKKAVQGAVDILNEAGADIETPF